MEKIINFESIGDLISDMLFDDDTEIGCSETVEIDYPFEIKSEEYLRFAEEDLYENGSKGLINSLSNAKRAMESRIDAILHIYGFHKISLEKKFPQKVNFIKELGIVAPVVLEKVNKLRNVIEHKYQLPDSEKVSDFVDIVSLFLASTSPYLLKLITDFRLDNDSLYDFWLELVYDNKEAVFKIQIHYFEEMRIRTYKNEVYRLDIQSNVFLKLLKLVMAYSINRRID